MYRFVRCVCSLSGWPPHHCRPRWLFRATVCHGVNQQSRLLCSCGLFFSTRELLCHQSRGQGKGISASLSRIYLSIIHLLSPIFHLSYLFDDIFILEVIIPLKIKKGILDIVIFFLLSIIELIFHINILLKHLQKFCFLLTKISICNVSHQFKHLVWFTNLFFGVVKGSHTK